MDGETGGAKENLPDDPKEDELEEDEPEEYEQLIVVTGVKRLTDTEFLKLYFENPSKSGGGEIEAFERESKTGAISITFKDQSVTSKVAGKRHKLAGATLKVKLITKKKHCQLPINARCLFLEGIPDGCSSEHVKLFIEYRSSMDEEPTIQYGQKPGTALCTFSRDIPDLDAAVANISKKKLQGVVLTADKVREADAVLVTGFSKKVSLDVIECYFCNTKKSGGGGVTYVQPGPKDGQAVVYFEDWKVVKEVLCKDTHRIGRKEVQVEIYRECLVNRAFVSDISDKTSPEQLKRGTGNVASSIKGAEAQETGQKEGTKKPQVGQRVQVQIQGEQGGKVVDTQMLQNDHDEEYDQLIEVTGFKPSTESDVLKLHFENRRKSGGGEIKTMKKDSKTGAVRITFKDQSVAVDVEKRRHKINGAKLKVKLITKKIHRPLPINARCLFLEGIPDGCSSEHVKLFIENRASMDEEPTIQYGEKPGTAICTFPRDIPYLEKVIRKIYLTKMKGASLTAKKVHHVDAILVQGVPPDLEMVELYFDNPKKSGSSGVRDVQQGPMDGQAIVYFEDWKVIKDVLTVPHKLGGKDLQIESYHDFLGRLSPLDAPTPHIPKPVLVEVQESIMEFLYGKGANTKKKLLKDLATVKANLLWPDGSQKSQAKLEPVEDESQHQSSWFNWEKEAVDVLTDFMRGYKTTRVPVPQPLWKGAADKLQKMTTTCSMVPDAQLHEVILVGEKTDVVITHATVNDIIIKLQKKADYDAEQATEDINWDTEKLQLFTMCGIEHEIEKSFPALKITVFSTYYGKTGIKLDGMRKTIKDVELKIRRMMDTLEKTEFKAGSTKVRFVQHATNTIHDVLWSRKVRAACSGSDDGKITIHGATSRDIWKAKAYIDNEIDEDVIRIKGSALAVVQGHEGKKLFESISNQKLVMAGIVHETGARFIRLAGFKRNLDGTKEHIMSFLRKNITSRSIIPSSEIKIRLITTYHSQELDKLTQQHQHNRVAIQPQICGRNRGFIIQGNEEGLDAVRKLVTSLVQAVKEKQYHVSKTGMARLLREEKSKTFLESVEREFHCVITTDCNEESDDDEDEEGAGHASTATQILYSVTLPESRCRLRVCHGDLTRQRVDCIVNAANVELKHIGGLAAAVLEAGGPVIQTESDDILKQKRRKLHVGEAVLTSSGNLPCKKVIHVAGPKWQAWERRNRDGDTTEKQQLFNAVFNCLQLASELNFQSIAIPAVSTGVYGFPVHLAAEQFLNAVGQFVWTTPNSSITDISLTNHDQPTCAVFMQAVAERFAGCLHDQAAGTDVDVTMAAAAGGPDRNRAIPVGLPNPAIETPRFTVSGLNVVTLEGLTIKMTKGSIAVEAVDVIVNTAGSDMNLTIGKVSQAISQAAGPTLQQECNTLIAARGSVASWLFVETGPGLLTCKKIYHCVCEGYKQLQSEQFLKKLVLGLMVYASRNGMTSMAIPALGTGNLSYPPAVTARCMYDAAFEFSRQHPNGSLKDVRFVVYDKDMTTIKGFEDEIQRLDPLSPGAIGGSTGGATEGANGEATAGATGGGTKNANKKKLKKKKSSSSAVVTDRRSYSEIREGSPGILQTNIGSVCLQIQQGDLVRELTHAIVNSVGKGLHLQGPVSQAILKNGGQSIKKQCDVLAKKEPNASIYVTGAGSLLCKSIVHVVTPNTPEGIKAVVAKALQRAEKDGFQSLSFPALGTGNVGQSVSSCADVMLKAIGEFACRKKLQYHLRLIRLVIFQREMLTDFQKALKEEVGHSYKQSKGILQRRYGVEDDMKEEELQETVIEVDDDGDDDDDDGDEEEECAGHASTSGQILYSVTLPDSACRLRVVHGDLTKQRVDCIVNAANVGLQHTGGLAAAVRKAGGNVIQTESDDIIRKQKGRQLRVGEAVSTSSGSLPCKKVIHVVGPRWQTWERTNRGGGTTEEHQLYDAVFNCLQLASDLNFQSIAIPAISTGVNGFPVQLAAEQFLNAVGQFVWTTPYSSITDISLTNHDQPTCAVFKQAVATRFSSSLDDQAASTDFDTTMAAPDILAGNVSAAEYKVVKKDKKEKELQGTVTLKLSAMDMKSLVKASDKLDRFQDEEFLIEDFPDFNGRIDKMTSKHNVEIIQIERKCDVCVTVGREGRGKFIRVEGCRLNVKDALLDISKMFTRIQKEETEKQLKIKDLAKEVKWKYSTPSGMEDYDEDLNALLEEAYQKKKPTVTLDMEDGRAVIDFQQMQGRCKRSVINVHRVDLKSAARFEPPSNWTQMKQREFTKMVKLTAESAEYTAVETKFRASVGAAVTIIKIKRIQNRALMMQYQTRRAALENRLNRTTNIEMVLYHGTDKQTSKKIRSHGFNRSFFGKNASAYGKGTYFAVAASYSASPQYAKPDANGTKHVFVTKVLVGDYIRGSHGMITPPPKPQNPAELFDSVVDNMNYPGIYVIFHDAQAYPEYLIKFQ
ncbi:protein mono-ADP-ribosyltransferase PARP14-like isoform X2 [Asterias amurensis]|uniref:protein mono-ADP-ribosyltransferase PARP14-like isoform X2 n=1 Tax=Asterias amurensis TaxID=7602 RepID=UPI003AB416AF